MTQSGATPGPWLYSEGYPSFVAAPDAEEPGNALKAMVCDLDSRLEKYQRPQEEIDANGRLIAAAPDLLDACRAAREFLGEYPAMTGGIFGRGLARQLDAAIAKVEGE